MRKAIPFAVVAAMVLVTADHMLTERVLAQGGEQASGQVSVTETKGDRLVPQTPRQASATGAAGLALSVVVKDHTTGDAWNPRALSNASLLARGFSTMTGSDSASRDPLRAAGPTPPPKASDEKLPRGCEAAASPLSSAASSRLHARCVADAGGRVTTS